MIIDGWCVILGIFFVLNAVGYVVCKEKVKAMLYLILCAVCALCLANRVLS